MLGFDRSAARYVWTAALVLALLGAVFMIRKTLFMFIVAVLLAYLLSPLVNLLDRVLPTSRSRTAALAIAYVIFVGGLILVFSQVAAQVVEQATSLSRSLPEQLSRWQHPSPESGPGVNSLRQQVIEMIRNEITNRSSDLLAQLPSAGFKLLAAASDLIYIVIVPILAFFFLKDGKNIRDHLLALLEEGPRRALMDDVLGDLHVLLAQYMRALVLLSLATFVSFNLAFLIIGVPYGVLLATIACMLEFIPMLGPVTAGLTIVVVVAASGGHVLAVVIFLIAFRFLQDYGLSPYLMGAGVELHPLLVLFGVFAGAELAGIPGTFLSVPALALIRLVYRRIRKARAGLVTSRPQTAPSVTL